MKNKKVFIIHGFEGKPNGGWKSWLMMELDKLDIYACSLPMPYPEAPVLSDWLEEIKRQVDIYPNDDIYLVGHSLGGTLILRYFEKYNDTNIKGVIILSARSEKFDSPKATTFFENDFDFNLIKSRIQNPVVIHGDNDPYVPVSNAERTAKELDGQLILIPNGQHLNNSAGFHVLPECLNALLEMINKF